MQHRLTPYITEARNLLGGYTYELPDGVSIEPTEDIVTTGPGFTVLETDSTVYVQAWIGIPKALLENR